MKNHVAAKVAVVAKTVAFHQVAMFGALVSLAAVANALAHALVQAAQRFAQVAVVQSPVGTLAAVIAARIVLQNQKKLKLKLKKLKKKV